MGFEFINDGTSLVYYKYEHQFLVLSSLCYLYFYSNHGKFVNDEVVYQGPNVSYATAQAILYSFTQNTHIDIIRVQGEFLSGNVKGNTSSANWIINTISETATMNTAFEDIVDNARIESEADGILDFTESNPFGEA